MGAERMIQEALAAAGDPSGAFLWRRVCRDLDGDLRIGVVAQDEGVATRLVRSLQEDERIEWVTLRVEEAGGSSLSPTLGTQDRMLGVHALVWATPVNAPLGKRERSGMAALIEAGAPRRRAVAIADLELLAKMSDEPDQEAADVLERVSALASDWEVFRSDDLRGWIESVRSSHTELIGARRRTVAQLLLTDARRRAAEAVEQAQADVSRAEALLASEDEALEEARKAGRRVAAHILGSMRRETEALLVDLNAFLVALEHDLPGQVEAVPRLERVRRTLPHWLHHVVEDWVEDRLDLWRARVLEDLAEIQLDDEDLDRAQLLVPALHPAPVRAEGSWGQRLGVTAAVGGGAAMLLMGLWIPGLLAVTSGIAWSTLGHRAAQAGTRRALIEAAVDAVRGMGVDADRLLRDQIEALEDELDGLGEDRAQTLAESQAVARTELRAQRTARQERARSLADALNDLDRRIAVLGAEAHP